MAGKKSLQGVPTRILKQHVNSRILKESTTQDLIAELNSRGESVTFLGKTYAPTISKPTNKYMAKKPREKDHGSNVVTLNDESPQEKERLGMPSRTDTRVVRPTIGKNLASVLSKTLVSDWYAAVSELVCNSYDADSHAVHITVDSLENRVVIQDDGEGMDVQGLTNFFRLGDSVKVDNPISPAGRRRIGKFGIATVLLEYLSGAYKVESVHGNELNTVEDQFVGSELTVRSEPAPKKSSPGTKITLRDLKFKIGKDGFDPTKLEHKLRWDVPNVPDFDVYVNGKLVRKRSIVEYSAVYELDTDVDGEPLKGRLYFQNVKGKKSDKLTGVRIYVDGRAVGDPSMFRAGEIDERLDKGLLGIVHADFLRESITLDRSQFQEHDGRVEKTVDAVREVLRGIVNDLEHGKTRRGYYEQNRVFGQVEEVLQAAEYMINERMGKENGERLSLKLGFGDEAGRIARFNPEKRAVTINVENPMLVLLPRPQGISKRQTVADAYLERAFIAAAAHALTNHQLGPSSNGLVDAYDAHIADTAKELFGKHTQLASQISKFIKGERIIEPKDINWSKFRLYDHFELANLTGRHPNVFRYLFTSGASPATDDGYFRAREIIPVLERISGYVPCIQLVEPKFNVTDYAGGAYKIVYTHPKPSELDVNMQAAKFKGLGVMDIGVKHPYHFVPITERTAFVKKVREENLYPNPK